MTACLSSLLLCLFPLCITSLGWCHWSNLLMVQGTYTTAILLLFKGHFYKGLIQSGDLVLIVRIKMSQHFICFYWLCMHHWFGNSSSERLKKHSSSFQPAGVSSDSHSTPDPVSWMMLLPSDCDPVEVIKALLTFLCGGVWFPWKAKRGGDCLVIKRLPIPAVVAMAYAVGRILFSHQLALSAVNSFSSGQEMGPVTC